jgi:malonate decarboxylase beta subunit
MSNQSSEIQFINRQSFIELDARERAVALLDAGTARELVGPFDRVESPWLQMQSVTPQADDGCVVMKGKITAALDLACTDNENGIPTSAVVLLETGGVRLQEANLGLAAIAEIMASILALRKHAPVICLTAGSVGCFGGMALAAGLASYVVMTREARLGMNGPEVIEQENGVDEFDSTDRALIWAIHGGEQRHATGLADALVNDDTQQIADTIRRFVAKGVPPIHRSSQVALYRNRVEALDTSRQWDPKELRTLWTASSSEGEQR